MSRRRLRSNYPQAHNNIGNALKEKGRLDEAIAAFRKAISFNPNFPDANYNFGNALHANGQLDEAVAAYRQAIALVKGGVAGLVLKPGYCEAHNNLGNALKEMGQLDTAIAAYRAVIALKPDLASAHNNLGNALKDQGQLDQAIAAYRHAISLNPGYSEAHSNLLLALQHHPNCEPGAIAEEHRRWDRPHAEPLKTLMLPHSNDRDPSRRLRIGYVSPDLREHPVGRFLLPLLAHHDPQGFEIFAYAQWARPDSMTHRLRSNIDQWRSIAGLSDDQAADLIRQDQVDILVDLSGHTAHHRLLVFARKPAPVQVTWLGYPDTTGLKTIDYRLTDAYADPPGQTESQHSEQLVRLSPCAWCFNPTQRPPVTPRHDAPGQAQDTAITFGSFNNFAKVAEPMLNLWGRILRAVPGPRLLLKAAGLASEDARRRVQHVLNEYEIASDRLELRGHEPDYVEHLALYGRMDIALDTFPYHGTTTTCEALWMGVPVVTLAGPRHVSRVGVSLLSNAGTPELITDTPDYVHTAISLAGDLPRLDRIRSTLRRQLEQSPLMDAPRFARDVEAAYRQMWRKWCVRRQTTEPAQRGIHRKPGPLTQSTSNPHS